jgi:hypothetical protein
MIRGVTKVRIADLLWNKTFNSLNPTVASAMTNNAFNQHRRFIHFVHSGSKNLHKKGHPNHNPLQKVQPVIDMLSKTQKIYWNVGRVICVDKCMVLLKSGLIRFIQYICCSKSGYLFAFEVYTGKDNTSEGSAYVTVMRMLRDSVMASKGNGRTLETDNWYSSGSLMDGVWKEFGMTFMGTINLTNKKSRTADDFPFHKLSKGTLRRVKRGWSRTATQIVEIGRQTAFTMQASVWRDKKQVAMLQNVDVI